MIQVAGYNRHKQLIAESNDPENKNRINPALAINIGSNIRSFSTYAHHSIKIDENGHCFGIGKDQAFRIGTPNRTTYTEFAEVKFDGIDEAFISAFCGIKYTIYITESYKLILCSELDAHPAPRIFTLDTRPVSLFGGAGSCSIIDERGDIYVIIIAAIYDNINTNSPKSDFYHLYPSLHLPSPALTIAMGHDILLILTSDDHIYKVRFHAKGTIEEPTIFQIKTVNEKSKIVQISGTANAFFAVDSEGKVYGYSPLQKFNLLATSSEEHNKKFVLVDLIQKVEISSAFCGIGHSIFIAKNGELFTAGSNRFRQLMVNGFNETMSPTPLKVEIGKSNRAVFAIAGNALTVVFLNSVPKHCPNLVNNLILRPSTPKKISVKRFKPKVFYSDSPDKDSPSTVKKMYSSTMREKSSDKMATSPSGPSSPLSMKTAEKPPLKLEKSSHKSDKSSHETAEPLLEPKKVTPKSDTDLKTKLQNKEKEVERLTMKTKLLMKILQKKNSDPKEEGESLFISREELNDFHHVKYLSRTETADILQVNRITSNIRYFTLKKFKTANFKEFRKFYREFEIISSISHPCIVKFYRYTNTTKDIEYPLLILEYFPYNLRQLMKDHKTETFGNTNKVEVIVDLAFGLKFLHETKHIMHRNLKPENILLTKKYHAKIGDFAWANSIDVDLVYSKKGTGSMPYMAPELLNGDDYDERIDQFSFGKIMYFILSGGNDPPFNMNDIENGITFKRISLFNDLAAEIMQKCCSYEPETRPTFSEILEMIQKGDFMLLPNVDSQKLKERLIKLEILEEIGNPNDD